MEAIGFLQVGAIGSKCPTLGAGAGHVTTGSCPDRSQVVNAGAGVGAGAARFTSGRTAKNGKLGGRSSRAKRGFMALAMSVAESTASSLEEARKESLQKEIESRDYTITETEVTAPRDFNVATVTGVADVALGVRCITLSVECSREFVSLKNAYRKPGQLVDVKVGEDVTKVTPCSAPFSDEINYTILLKIRGDIPAGTTKLPAYSLSAKAPLDIHVTEAESPALYNVKQGTEVELGSFEGTGLDMRPIMFIARYPTILLFAQGNGIAVARAILETKDADAGTLNLGLREDVRLFYSAPSPSQLAYKALYSKWEEKKAVKVRTVVENSDGEEYSGYTGSLTSLWDEDDIEYDPLTTGVVVAVESGRRDEVKSLVAEAGIPDAQVVYWEV